MSVRACVRVPAYAWVCVRGCVRAHRVEVELAGERREDREEEPHEHLRTHVHAHTHTCVCACACANFLRASVCVCVCDTTIAVL